MAEERNLLEYKEIIEYKYRCEKLTTAALRQYMIDQYSVFASVQQYERIRTKWKLGENISGDTYGEINQELKRKRLTPDEADVFIDGDLVPRKKLKRGISRFTRPVLAPKFGLGSNAGMASACGDRSLQKTVTDRKEMQILIRPSLHTSKKIRAVRRIPSFGVVNLLSELLSTTQIRASRPLKGATFEIQIGGKETEQPFLTTPHWLDNKDAHGSQKVSGDLENILSTARHLWTSNLPDGNREVLALRNIIPTHCEAQLFRQIPDNVTPTSQAVLLKCDNQALLQALSHLTYSLLNNPEDYACQQSFATIFMVIDIKLLSQAICSLSSSSTLGLITQLLLHARRTEDFSLLERRQKLGIDINTVLPMPEGPRTILQASMEHQNRGIFTERLLELGADPNLCSCTLEENARSVDRVHQSITIDDQEDFCCCCCCSNSPLNLILDSSEPSGVLSSFIKHGVRFCGCFDLASLMAVAHVDCDFLERLLNSYPGILEWEGAWNPHGTLLQTALHDKAYDLAKVLLRHGAEVDLTTDLIEWAIIAAETHCTVGKLDATFHSPLTLAFEAGSPEMAEMLLAAGADLRSSGVESVAKLDKFQKLLKKNVQEARLVFQKDWNKARHPPAEGLEALETHSGKYTDNPVCTPLQAACYSGSKASVESLLKAGASLESSFGLPCLLLAVISSHHEIIQLLLDNGASPNYTEVKWPSQLYQLSPLAQASARGDSRAMQKLLEAGADINHCHTERGMTALQAAIVFYPPDEVIQLLLHNPKVDIWHSGCSVGGLMAMSAAILYYRWDVINLLISHEFCKKYDTLSHQLLDTALSRIESSHDPVIELLFEIRSKCSALIAEQIAINVLEHATRSGYIELAHSLLSLGTRLPLRLAAKILLNDWKFMREYALLGSRNVCYERMQCLIETIVALPVPAWSSTHPNGFLVSLLHICYGPQFRYFHRSGRSVERADPVLFRVIKALLHLGVDCNSYSCTGGCLPGMQVFTVNHITEKHPQATALQYAAALKDSSMVDLMLRNGANINELPPNEENFTTALGIACTNGDQSLLQKLLDAKADVNLIINADGESALMVAAAEGRDDIVVELLNHGANVEYVARSSTASRYRTPLQAACHRKSLETIDLLIDKGASVNVPEVGETPLQVACGVGNIAIVKTLLEKAAEKEKLDIVTLLINHGADVNAPAAPVSGVTALQAAAINGCGKICQVLIGCGAKVSAPASPEKGRTAINGAAERGRLDVVKYLLDEYDGDKDIADVCVPKQGFSRGREVTWRLMTC